MANVTKTVQRYNHNQTSEASIWVITHNLNTPGIVIDIMVNQNGNLEKIIPLDITMNSANVDTITFTQSFTGVASIVG